MSNESLFAECMKTRWFKIFLASCVALSLLIVVSAALMPSREGWLYMPSTSDDARSTLTAEEIKQAEAAGRCDRWYFERGQYLPPYRNPCPKWP
jgi:hypothetical protein